MNTRSLINKSISASVMFTILVVSLIGSSTLAAPPQPYYPPPPPGYRPDPTPYDPPYPTNPPSYRPNPPPYVTPGAPRKYVRQAQVGRYFRGEALDLVYITGMDQRFDRGARLEYVEVFLQDSGRSSLALYADRNVVASSNFLNPITMLQANQYLEFGRNFQNLQLSVGGKLWIERIVVHLVKEDSANPPPYPPPYPQPNPGPGDHVDFRINQDFFGLAQLDLFRMLDLYRYRGLHMAELEVSAMPLSSRQPAILELVINGYSQGSVAVDQYSRSARFFPRSGVIGGGADSVLLIARGDVRIENVRIRFFSRR